MCTYAYSETHTPLRFLHKPARRYYCTIIVGSCDTPGERRPTAFTVYAERVGKQEGRKSKKIKNRTRKSTVSSITLHAHVDFWCFHAPVEDRSASVILSELHQAGCELLQLCLLLLETAAALCAMGVLLHKLAATLLS